MGEQKTFKYSVKSRNKLDKTGDAFLKWNHTTIRSSVHSASTDPGGISSLLPAFLSCQAQSPGLIKLPGLGAGSTPRGWNPPGNHHSCTGLFQDTWNNSFSGSSCFCQYKETSIFNFFFKFCIVRQTLFSKKFR